MGSKTLATADGLRHQGCGTGGSPEDWRARKYLHNFGIQTLLMQHNWLIIQGNTTILMKILSLDFFNLRLFHFWFPGRKSHGRLVQFQLWRKSSQWLRLTALCVPWRKISTQLLAPKIWIQWEVDELDEATLRMTSWFCPLYIYICVLYIYDVYVFCVWWFFCWLEPRNAVTHSELAVHCHCGQGPEVTSWSRGMAQKKCK